MRISVTEWIMGLRLLRSIVDYFRKKPKSTEDIDRELQAIADKHARKK